MLISATRTIVSDSILFSSAGNEVTFPIFPKLGLLITLTVLPSWIPLGIFDFESSSVFPESIGITISGLITPARICVAPFIEAALPSFSFSNEKVASLIGIEP